MPLRVSFVPPDFEITTVSVSPNFPWSASSTRSMPSGSVLSMKHGFKRSRDEPSAAATNSGPSAEPPMPMTSRREKFPAAPRTRPWCTSAANCLMAVTVSTTARVMVSSGARDASRSQ